MSSRNAANIPTLNVLLPDGLDGVVRGMNEIRHRPGQRDPHAAAKRQLDGLLATFWLPARQGADMCGVANPAELPWALEERIRRLSPGDLWRAYSDGVRVWFVTARAVPPSFPAPAAVALRLRFFGNDGAACAAGIWQRTGATPWSLSEVLEGMPVPRLLHL